MAQKSWHITFLAFCISLPDAEQLVDQIYEEKSILKNLDISRFVKVRQDDSENAFKNFLEKVNARMSWIEDLEFG